jgi:two-component system, NarL family, response regulator LiaR
MGAKKNNKAALLKQVILYGVLLGVVAAAMELLKFNLIVMENTFEVYALLVALVFGGVGIWVGIKLFAKNKPLIVVEGSGTPGVIDEEKIKELGISKREHEVLELIARGHTNQEVAELLFVSPNTVKTHLANIFAKLDVNRRTQAIQRAKDLNILP